MRRVVLIGLVLASACLGTAPTLVASIQIQSNATSAGIFPGDQLQLTASPLDINGNVMPVAIAYTSSNTTVATVSTTGLISALSAGTSDIGVSAGGQSAHLTLTVDGNVTGSVSVSPTPDTVHVGGQQQFTATVFTSLHNPARNKTVSWTSGDPTHVAISATGLATGNSVTSGVSVCAAASDAPNITGCATLVVIP